jgi:hypothetical protein
VVGPEGAEGPTEARVVGTSAYCGGWEG